MENLEKLLSDFKEAFYCDDLRLQSNIHTQIQSYLERNPDLSKFESLEYEKYVKDVDEVNRCLAYIHGND